MIKKSIDVKNWAKNRIKKNEFEKYLVNGKDFIDDNEIIKTLKANNHPGPEKIKNILAKSLAIETLTLDETAALLNVTDTGLLREMEKTALQIKKKVYDNRIVTFAPLYLSNLCLNDCLYCGFRQGNKEAKRKILSLEEVRKETEVLAGKIGHKRLIVVYGEHPRADVRYMVKTIKEIYKVKAKTKHGFSRIRRVNVNAAPMPVNELKILKRAGLGTYQVFQETYHHDTYATLHPRGTLKSDYRWRLYTMHRALEAGIDDVGIGALFGLYDWKFEVMGLVAHARELEKQFGIGPHTISFPRLEPAANAPYTIDSRHKVSDRNFEKLITVIRLSVPYTGMIITARETPQMRRRSIQLGVTQTDASTRIGIGAYSGSSGKQETKRQQFLLGDTRSLEELIAEFCRMGYITSFCTAGYRCGRTGECIMDLLKTGQEGKFCKLNAILTFREWLDDFAGPATKKIGEKVINRELAEIKEKMPKIYPKLIEYYEKIKKGERDLYF